MTVRRAGSLFLIFGLATMVRAIPWRRVVTDSEGILLVPSDPYYHMWRIWNAASNSVAPATRDAFVNFPFDGEILWSPAFDWILATMIRWLGLDQPTAELLCAWVPVVLGSAAVALAAQIAWNTFSPTAGWTTGLLLAVLPGSYVYSRLGNLDHHAAVSLIATVMLGGAMHVVSERRSTSRFWPILAGALCAFALSIWAGALLHIGFLQIAMLTWGPGATTKEIACTRTTRLAVAHAVTAVAIMPLSLRNWDLFGNFSPVALTLFQPTYLAAGAICLASAALVWKNSGLGDSRVRRLATLAALGAVGLLLAFSAIPELAATLDRSAGWFTGDVAFLSSVRETAPLFSSANGPAWTSATTYFSLLFFALPLAMLAVVWRAPQPERWLLLFWTAAFCALTIIQNRFTNTFSIPYAIVWGAAISILLGSLRSHISKPPMQAAASTCAGLLVAAIVLIPAWIFYEPQLQIGSFPAADARRSAFRSAARWLAENRPSKIAENGRPEAGLLCNWGNAHEFRYYSGWPMHHDGFGPYVSPENVVRANRYFEEQDEEKAIAILAEMGTRYVVSDVSGAGGHGQYFYRSMAGRLGSYHGSGGLVRRKNADQPAWVPALSRHRLIFEAPDGRRGVWLYEIVPGAIVTGSATPNSIVSAKLRLRSISGRSLRWITRARADKTGNFRLRVPYSTRDAPPSGIAPLGQYELHTDRGIAPFGVKESAIREGAILAAPLIQKS